MMMPRNPIRVLVCGGRDFADAGWVDRVLGKLSRNPGIACVIEGGALGADRLGREWADACGVPVETFPADWNAHGRAAGPIRNGKMLQDGKPDLVVAFPGGRGTANMKRQARAAGVEVLDVTEAEPED